MKSFSKKAAAALLILSSVAVAGGLISKDEVNKKIATITAPYNDAATKLVLEFTDLNVDAVRALDFGLTTYIAKKGPENEVLFKLENAAYHYGNGTNPTITGDLNMKMDLVKYIGQDSINSYAQDFEQMAKDMSAEYTQKYGDAVTIDAKMLELIKDAKGDVVSAKVLLAAVIDFSKLPAKMKAADVEFKSFQANLSVSRTDLSGKMNLVMNPLNTAFEPNQPGLKEFIEKLLGDDKDTYHDIGDFVQLLNSIADSIVNQPAQNPPPAPAPQP